MSPLPTHHRRLSSSGDKETLLGHLIPDPTHSHAPRRTASTAVLVLFAATVLFIAFGGTGGGVGSGVEQGVEWINFKSVPWGSAAADDQRPAGELYQAGQGDASAEQDDYQSGSEPLEDDEYESESKAVEQPEDLAAGQSAGTFSDDVATRVNALLASGALARYIWHKRLPSTQWNQSSDCSLVVVGDVHGQHESLSTLLTRVSPTSRSAVAPTLLHTGDLVSKAPLNSSLATVALMRNKSIQGVRGNHDQGVVEWREWIVAYGRLLTSTAAAPVAEDVVEKPSTAKAMGKGRKGKGMGMKGAAKPEPWSGYGVKGEAIPSVDEAKGYVSSPDEEDRRRRKNAAGLRGPRGAAKTKRSWWSSPPPDPVDELEEDPEASGEGDLEELSGGEYEPEEEETVTADDAEITSIDDDLDDATAAPTATGKSTPDYEFFDDENPEPDSTSPTGTTGTASATATDANAHEDDDETTTARGYAHAATTSSTSTQGRFHRPRPTAISNSTAAATSLTTPSRLGSSTFWTDKDGPHGVNHASLESGGALVGDGWEWLELSESEAKMLGVEVPVGWEWGGDWFEIARHLPLDDYEYLAALPLTLFVEDLASYIVHAGMLPWVDTRDALPPYSTLPSIPSPLKSVSLQSFTPSMTTSSVLLGPARSLLLVPQNTAPFTLLNMRAVRQRGSVYLPQKTKTGKAWHGIWNDFWDRCEDEQPSRCTEKVGILYGHWAGQGLTVNPQSIGLDSGCAAGNRLSAFVLSPGTSSPLSGTRSTRSRPSHTLISTRRHRLAARAWGWGSGKKPATLAADEDEDEDEPATAKEVVAEEVEQEADITEADEDAIDDEAVAEVDPDTAFEEERVEFAGVSAWVVSVKCDGSDE